MIMVRRNIEIVDISLHAWPQLSRSAFQMRKKIQDLISAAGSLKTPLGPVQAIITGIVGPVLPHAALISQNRPAGGKTCTLLM
jgi:hypothetical protein